MDWIVTLGPAKPGDAPRLATFVVAHGLPDSGLAEHVEDFIVARDDGRLVGTVGLERAGEEAFLRSLAVDVAHRGRGLGRRLVQEALERAIRKGIRRVYLLAEARPAYFASMGFQELSRDDFPAAFPGQREIAEGRCAARQLMARDLA